jgi:hypothetical protein
VSAFVSVVCVVVIWYVSSLYIATIATYINWCLTGVPVLPKGLSCNIELREIYMCSGGGVVGWLSSEV